MRLAMEGPDRSNVYLKLALGVSVAAHVVLLSVKFVLSGAEKLSNTVPIDVILVNSKTVDKPTNPQALAQANLDGGGNTDENRRIKTALPMQKTLMLLRTGAAGGHQAPYAAGGRSAEVDVAAEVAAEAACRRSDHQT